MKKGDKMNDKGFWPWFFQRHSVNKPFTSTLIFLFSIIFILYITLSMVAYGLVYNNALVFVVGILQIPILFAIGWIVTEYGRYIEDSK